MNLLSLIFGLQSLSWVQPVTAQTCPSSSVMRDVVYGVPEAGCCHYAKAAAVICDPYYSKQEACEAQGADVIQHGVLVAGPSDCARLCAKEKRCVIWSYVRSRKVGKRNTPATCTLVQEQVACAPATCYTEGAVTGRKDCSLQGLLDQAQEYDPQRTLYSVAQDYVKRPICETTSQAPDLTGFMEAGLLVQDTGCRDPIWDYQGSAQKCVQGSWVIIVGGSNSVLIAAQMANLMTNTPSSMDPGRSMVTIASFVDLVIEETIPDPNQINPTYEVGKIVHSNYEFYGTNRRWADIPEKFEEALGKAPAYKPSLTRVTLFVGQYWDNVEDAIHFARRDKQWGTVPATLVTQVSTWYQMAGHGHNHGGSRSDMRFSSMGNMYAAYRNHLKSAIKNELESWCGPDGPGAIRGCTLTSSSYSGHADPAAYGNIDIMREEIQASALQGTNQLRFIDIHAIGVAAGASESMEAHSSPAVMAWFWQLNFARICPAVNAPPSPKPLLKFNGPCFAGQVRWNKCPECQANGVCFALWICAHSAICDVSAVTLDEIALTAKSDFSCNSGKSTNNGRRLADAFQVSFKSSDEGANLADPCDRLTCDSSWQVFPVVLSVVLAVGLAMLYLFFYFKQRRQKAVKDDSVVVVQPAAAEATTDATYEVNDEVENNNVLEDNGQNLQKDATDLSNEKTNTSNQGFVEVKPANPVTEEKQTTDKVPSVAQEHFPLGLARFLASIHVVVGHMWQKGAVGDVWFYGWGFTWVPWFFMLSGFVLFHAECRRPTQEWNLKEQMKYFAKRTVTIYPLYAFALPFAWIINWQRDSVPGAGYIISQIWMVQSWVPYLTEWVFPYMEHCWFLSCMVVYWMLFQPLAWLVNRMGLVAVSIVMTVLFIFPWLMLVIPAAMSDVDWYTDHKWKQREDALDYFVVFFKFHPVCYLHVFVIGMLLQKWRLLVGERENLRKILRWPVEALSPIAYLVLILIFAIKDITMDDGSSTWGHKLTARVSVLLPLQAAILLGLAGLPKCPTPFVGKAAAYVEFLADYSYGVYICHMLCFAVWPTESTDVNGWYFVFTIATAIVLVLAVQKPIQPWWRKNPGKTILIPLFLTVLLPTLTVIDSPGTSISNTDSLAESIMLDEGVQDVRLPFADAGKEGDLINPSVIMMDGQMVAVARRHSRSFSQRVGTHEGQPATIMDVVWNSEIVLGAGWLKVDRRLAEAAGAGSALEKWAQGSAPTTTPLNMAVWSGLQTTDGKPWSDLCVKTTWIPENKTLIRHVVTGPEDPKVFNYNNNMAIAFSSYPPLGEDGCGPEKELGAVHQMYLATGVDPGWPDKVVIGNRMSCGWRKLAEKNWIPFQRQGSLYFVYEPQPHKIMLSRDDGTCAEGFRTNFLPLQKLVQDNPHLEVRGNAQAVYVNDPTVTSNLPGAHYLAIFHIYDKLTGRYAHHAYRFNANPPFEILQISEELPLSASKPSAGATAIAFVSGLALEGRAVMISYGSGDSDARALVLTLQKLDAMFPCCNDPCVPGSFYRTTMVGHWGKHQRGDFDYAFKVGQECKLGTTEDSTSVMCCGEEQKSKRICDLCDGDTVFEDEVAGHGCFSETSKVGGNCVDQDIQQCKANGGKEIRGFTCKELQDYLYSHVTSCNERFKSDWAEKCCRRGRSSVTRRRSSGRKLHGLAGKKRLLASGNISSVPAPVHHSWNWHRPARQLANMCPICKSGTLIANNIAGQDRGRSYSCGDAQKWLNGEGAAECDNVASFWEGPCCAMDFNAGCRDVETGDKGSGGSGQGGGCSHNDQCQSSDCQRDGRTPFGCHDGQCYGGMIYDERCKDKPEGSMLDDGGFCTQDSGGTSIYVCAADAGEEAPTCTQESCQSEDCQKDGQSPLGCHAGECYRGTPADDRCKDKPDGSMLDDGGACHGGTSVYLCKGNPVKGGSDKCSTNEDCFESPDCSQHNDHIQHGCHEGVCYVGKQDDRCEGKNDLHDLGDGGWCFEGRRDTTCKPKGSQEEQMQPQVYGTSRAGPGVFIMGLYENPDRTCSRSPMSMLGFDFTMDSCWKYPVEEEGHPLRGMAAKIVSCKEKTLTIQWLCNGDCTKCEPDTDTYIEGECRPWPKHLWEKLSPEAGTEFNAVIHSIQCPCTSICSPDMELNKSLVIGKLDNGSSLTCGSADALQKDFSDQTDGDPYSQCDKMKGKNWAETCCHEPVMKPGMVKLEVFQTNQCNGEKEHMLMDFGSTGCAPYPNLPQLAQVQGAYFKMVACSEDAGTVTVEHVCDETCTICQGQETYSGSDCTASNSGMNLIIGELKCPCYDICPEGTEFQEDGTITNAGGKEFSCGNGQEYMRQNNNYEVCRDFEGWTHNCCASKGRLLQDVAPQDGLRQTFTPTSRLFANTSIFAKRFIKGDWSNAARDRLAQVIKDKRASNLSNSMPDKVAKAVVNNARRTLSICEDGASYEAAQAHCQSLGQDLCTSDEIKDGWGLGKCEGSDSSFVWTSDACVPGVPFPPVEPKEW